MTETRSSGDGPPARSLRLFVAVNVPDDVKAGVAEALEPFRDRIPAPAGRGGKGGTSR